jgi:pilus assembly protein CpaB
MNFSSMIKNRTIVGFSCIVLSLLICFGITPLFNNALKAQVEVIRVSKDIAKGEAITEERIKIVKVGGYNLPKNIVKSADDLKGKYATAELMKGDYILSSKLTDKPYEDNEYLYKLNGTRQAISVSIKNFALGLSGKLKSGDIVSIIASDYGEMRQTLIPPELKYVEILAVTTAKGADENVQASKNDDDEEKQLPSTVTLLASPTQAMILADLEAKSKIHMALAYRGDETTVKKFLNAQDDILKQQGAGSSRAVIGQSTQAAPAATPSASTPPAQGTTSTSIKNPSVQGGVSDAQ